MSSETERILLQIDGRQARLLTFVAQGCPDQVMAERLTLAVATVRSAIRRLCLNLGVKSKFKLGQWWIVRREQWLKMMAECAGVASDA